MTLQEFIEANIPLELRHTRDYTGSRGWVTLMRQVLKEAEAEGYFALDRKVEIGVEVANDYWIDYPANCIEEIEIHQPPIGDNSEREITYNYDIVNGKIKLESRYDKDEDPDTFTLSAGSTTQITIDDGDATEDQWEQYLLVPTNGTYTDPIVLGEHEAAAGGVTVLNFETPQANAIDSTAGYITKTYLKLVYMKYFTGLSGSSDEIPVDDRFEILLTHGLCYRATPPSDTKRRNEYLQQWMFEKEQLDKLFFTPSPDQARPRARSMPAFENVDGFYHRKRYYTGEDE